MAEQHFISMTHLDLSTTIFQDHCKQQISDNYINGLVQDCSNSTANTLELLQSCTKSSMCSCQHVKYIHIQIASHGDDCRPPDTTEHQAIWAVNIHLAYWKMHRGPFADMY